jgi:inositol-phosphate phosphatase/L-galactose 1-phosphate phosphatase/histidinol-phosphatase
MPAKGDPTVTEIDQLEHHALGAARLAADTAMRFFRNPLDIEIKPDESPVTQADKAVEAAVRAHLRQAFPDHGIFGEEHGTEGGTARDLWVVDPIDGTRSFLSGNPLFGFLLAHLADDTVDLGVIGMPALGETYLGVPGRGASRNGAPIRVSGQTDLASAVFYLNEAEKIYRDRPELFETLAQCGQTRRFGYDCYPHALLASGLVDAVVDYDLQPYDFLAVSAVVEAAGGVMTDWQGNRLTRQSDGAVLAAATPGLHASLLALLNG